MDQFYVYILASRKNGTLYVGVTNDLLRRLTEHRAATLKSFTGRYNVHRLVHIEVFDDLENAIKREKRLKEWKRAWKVALFESANPSGAICPTTCSGRRADHRGAVVKPRHDSPQCWT